MRAHEGTARRYAKALYQVARDRGAVSEIGEGLGRLLFELDRSAEAHDVLTRPWIKGEDRWAIALAFADKAGCPALVRDFAGLLAERGRMDHLTEIVRAYRDLVDAELGQARADVRSAVPLTDAERGALRERLEGAVGKRILLEERLDPTLLGGFIAQVGSFIVDGSLDRQLVRMRERLAGG